MSKFKKIGLMALSIVCLPLACSELRMAPARGPAQTAPTIAGPLPFSTFQKYLSFGPLTKGSQYSPWVMKMPGWKSYVMYYCKNTPINGIYRDRIWRTESFTDGLTGFSNDQITVAADSLAAEDDLSCSPGVVIKDGVWHMYYVTANRNADHTLYLHHATANAPGTVWTKLGQVSGIQQPVVGYLETPSPILISNEINLYYVGNQGSLFLSISKDGSNFSSPVQLNAPTGAQSGRVSLIQGVYFYVYSSSSSGQKNPPTDILISTSVDGINFSQGVSILTPNNCSGWDCGYRWSPHLPTLPDGSLRIYYGANAVAPSTSHFETYSSIGAIVSGNGTTQKLDSK